MHYLIDYVSALIVLIVGFTQGDLISPALIRPKRLIVTVIVVLYNGVCRIENGLGRAVILLELDDACLGIGLVEIKNIFDGCATEAVYALVIVTNDHYVSVFIGKELGEDELRIVGILILVNEDVSELALVVLTHLVVSFEKLDGLHYYIVEVDGVVLHQLFLIELIYSYYITVSRIGLYVDIVGTLERVLCDAYCITDRLGRKALFIDSKLLHAYRYHTLFIVGIVYREAVLIAEAIAVLAKYAQADRVEGARPDRISSIGIVKRHTESVLYLLCRLVGEGDGEKIPGRAGLGYEFGEYIGYILGLHIVSILKCGNRALVKLVGYMR